MKIAIVEDHLLLSDLLEALCRREFKFDVVIRETRGRAALAAIRKAKPDLVLLDISLPDMDGLDVAEAILKELPQTKVLALSSLRDPVTLRRISDLGIHGFVDKRDQNLRVLKQAIDLVCRGHGFYSPIFNEVIGRLRRNTASFERTLSERERGVLSLIGESRSDEEIARLLGIQPATAQTHRRDIMQKLGIHTTPKLIRFAIENGFTRTERLQADQRGDA